MGAYQQNFNAVTTAIDAIEGNPQLPLGQKLQMLQQMLQRYPGYSGPILAAMNDMKQKQTASQQMQPQQPSVAQQVTAGAPIAEPQGMAKGGIVAFKQGGEVRKFDDGGTAAPIVTSARKKGYSGLLPGQEAAAARRAAIGESLGVGLVAPFAGIAHGLGMFPASATQAKDQAQGQTQAPAQGQTQAPAQAQVPPAPALTADDILRQQGSMGDVGGLGSLRQGSTVATGGSTGQPTESSSDIYKRLQETIGPNTALDEFRSREAENRQNALGQALLSAGFGIAGGRSPYAITNIAEGALPAVTGYTQEENARQRALLQAGQVERATQVGLARDAVMEANADRRAAQQNALARQSLGIQRLAYNPTLQEMQMTRKYAADLAARDVDQKTGQPRQPFGYYYGLAKQEIDKTMYGAGLSAEAKAARDRAAYITKMQALPQYATTPPERLGQMYDASMPTEGASSGGGTMLGTITR